MEVKRRDGGKGGEKNGLVRVERRVERKKENEVSEKSRVE